MSRNSRRKPSTSTRNSTPSSATRTSGRHEPMPHLSRGDPEAGFKPALPPKVNPWSRSIKPRKPILGLDEDHPPLPPSKESNTSQTKSHSSTSDQSEILSPDVESHSSSNSLINGNARQTTDPNPRVHRRSPSRNSSISRTSSALNDSSIAAGRTLRSASTSSEGSRKALLAAVPRVEEKSAHSCNCITGETWG